MIPLGQHARDSVRRSVDGVFVPEHAGEQQSSGSDRFAVLGARTFGEELDRLLPRRPDDRKDARHATAIAVGRNHALALLSGGTVKAWGSNSNGQLRDNSTTDRSSCEPPGHSRASPIRAR